MEVTGGSLSVETSQWCLVDYTVGSENVRENITVNKIEKATKFKIGKQYRRTHEGEQDRQTSRNIRAKIEEGISRILRFKEKEKEN